MNCRRGFLYTMDLCSTTGRSAADSFGPFLAVFFKMDLIPFDSDYLCIADDAKVTLGTPTIEGAKVIATSQGEAKGEKVVVFRYKPKIRYSRKNGHRQLHTRLLIDRIVGPGIPPEEPAPKPRRRRKGVTKDGA